jgi:hypothetical protein
MKKDVSAEEIRRTIFAITNNKAPDTDMFSMGFYKDAWSIMGMM